MYNFLGHPVYRFKMYNMHVLCLRRSSYGLPEALCFRVVGRWWLVRARAEHSQTGLLSTSSLHMTKEKHKITCS